MATLRRRRLVLLTTGYLDRGGVATRSRTLAGGFAERGWDVRVVARGAVNARLRVDPPPGVRLLEIPAPPGRIGSVIYLVLATVVGLAWGVRAHGFLAMQLLSPTTVAAVCSAVLRRPFICLTSMTGELSEVRLVTGSRFAIVRVPLVQRARCAVAQTAVGAEELHELFPADRVAVVPTPTALVAGDHSRRTRGLVLYAGRLAEEKGVLDLLAAWTRVVDGGSAARLVLAGGGGRDRSVEDEVRRAAAQPPLHGRTELAGWVDDMGSLLSTCDVFVLPSHTEGMSNALVEAVAHGCVVVASRIPGNTAVLGEDYPLLFEPRDVAGLAAALAVALHDDEVRAQAQRLVDERARSFATPAVVEALERLLSRDPG